MVNPPATGAVTMSDTVAVCVMPPPVAVTVIAYVPTAVVEATAKVRVDVPEPGAAKDVELRLTVTPAGAPVADNVTAESKPPATVLVMVELPLLPCTTETDAGDAESVRVGEVAVGARALISPVFGEPQPVTRS